MCRSATPAEINNWSLIRDLQLNSINFQEFCFVLGK